MNVSRELKKVEAIKRMKRLKIYAPIIKQFKDDDVVCLSEPPFGAHYWLDEDDKKHVADFEKTYNALVFAGIRSYMEFGKVDSYLLVSDYEDEWDRELDIKNGMAFAWAYNHDAPWCSEMGTIGIAPTPAAGLCRVW